MEPGTVLFPGKLMQNELTKEILDYVETALGVAQIGLTYSTNEFDIGRFMELRALSARLLAKLENENVEKVARWIAFDENYATPKVDVRAMVYDERGHILLVREKSDGGWTLPGGWCDMGESPSLSAEREVAEETGLQVKAVRLVALFDKLKHDHPPQIPHAYKLFFHCRKIGGEILRQTNETLDCAYFPVESLPALSLNRNTPKQIVELTGHIRSGSELTLFD